GLEAVRVAVVRADVDDPAHHGGCRLDVPTGGPGPRRLACGGAAPTRREGRTASRRRRPRTQSHSPLPGRTPGTTADRPVSGRADQPRGSGVRRLTTRAPSP